MMLNEYNPAYGEELYWDVECVWRPDGVTVDMYLVEDPDKPGIVNFYVRNIDKSDEKITFCATLSTSAGFSAHRYFTFNIRQLNVEDLPTELYVGETTRYMTENEHYRIYYNEFSTNGCMPEDAYFFIDGASELPFERYYENTKDGECLFMVPVEGEYTVYAKMIYSNYVITTPITLVVSK